MVVNKGFHTVIEILLSFYMYFRNIVNYDK